MPDSTPALDQPIPLSRLDTATAAPKAPGQGRRRGLEAPSRDHRRPGRLSSRPASPSSEPTFRQRSMSSLDELLEGIAGQEGVGLRGALDVLLPFGRLLHLLHEIDIERGLVGRDLARQPHRARLLELRDGEPLLDAGRDVGPALVGGDLRAVRQALRAERAERALRAALPLPDALAGIVDVRIDMAAGQLHRDLGAALEGDVGDLMPASLSIMRVRISSVSLDCAPPILNSVVFAAST